jgi:hypothetical protein
MKFRTKRLSTAALQDHGTTPGVSPRAGVSSRSPLGLRHSQRGIALVITLILLSVITFMAIAFLVLTRGQKTNSATAIDQALAKMAADSAQDRAVAEIVAQIMASGSEFNYNLIVSTNYINPGGFLTTLPANGNPYTNVNYAYPNGLPLNANDNLQNLANLIYNPRPPVFISTNGSRGSNEFRYYVDLNRNGRFDPTGWLIITNNGQPVRDPITQLPIVNYMVGDPQWIGGLEFPDRTHGPNNKFIWRYAYMVLPASSTLDVNYVYNQAANPTKANFDPLGRDYFRNQGVGTWEENLAAFLYDLNTNTYAWGPTYTYSPNFVGGLAYSATSIGPAVFDAFSILTNRYAGRLSTLAPVSTSFLNGRSAFVSDGFDGYSAGPLMLVSLNTGPDPDILPSDRTVRPWPGSDNTNHFFTIGELYDPTKSSVDFTTRLLSAGLSTNSSYDQYTFYRLASQLGTDSAPEPAGTINLNYDNLVRTNTQGIASITNYFPWDPAAFFTNAAQQLMVSAGYTKGVGWTNLLVTNNLGVTRFQIQVYPTNCYSASVHRLLQLAANIYDATTNRAYNGFVSTNGFPTVFRPFFRRDAAGRVFIVDFHEVLGTDMAFTNRAPVMADFDTGSQTNRILPAATPVAYDPNGTYTAEPMVTGIPLVVGARKGFPNFNQLAMQTEVAVTRKLEFLKHNATDDYPYITNQMYLISISNSFGLEAWNSFRATYPRSLQMIIGGDMTAFITNEFGLVSSNVVGFPFSNTVSFGTAPIMAQNTWGGFDDVHQALGKYSFRAPFYPGTNFYFFLPKASYTQVAPGRQGTFQVPYQTNFVQNPRNPFIVPQLWLTLRTRLRFILVDREANRIVDYVNLSSKDDPVDLTAALMDGAQNLTTTYRADAHPGSMWITNRGSTNLNSLTTLPTFGILNQITAGLGTNRNGLMWADPPAGFTTILGAENFFRTNLLKLGPISGSTFGSPLYLTNRFYAPYAPTRSVFIYTSWEANDPLVHYTVGDLSPLIRTNRFECDLPLSSPLANIGGMNLNGVLIGATDPVNGRYEPWGGYRWGSSSSTNKYTLALKDPAVTRSEDWDFPTNKFPNVGWLGRIHRGTPWQTVYLKSPPIDSGAWRLWSGNGQIFPYVGQINLNQLGQAEIVTIGTNRWFFDAGVSFPTNDWKLLDIFSTALYENSAFGRLNINQSGLAAWSAILSGVIVITNTAPDSYFANSPYAAPVYGVTNIQPAGIFDVFGPSTNWPALARIVGAINRTRASLTNQHQAFQHLGDILAVPELTVASPFLNPGTTANPSAGGYTYQQTSGLGDAAYERIPQQILGLLKCDHTPRFVIYAYGQALKPAEHSLVTKGGPFFQMCTNYQITAEVATRMVVRIDGVDSPNKSRPRAVIESFNVLPPD